MGMHQDIGNLQREYSRVDVYIPCEYRIVLEEEIPHVQARISSENMVAEHRHIPCRGDSDPVLEEWLQILNSKLDTIIHLMQVQQEGIFGFPYKTVNISGGGMSLPVKEAIPIGETLEIKVMLPFQQPVVLIIYGRVIKYEIIDGKHFVAVHYTNMDDFMRDIIVRFVFERERELIRETRE